LEIVLSLKEKNCARIRDSLLETSQIAHVNVLMDGLERIVRFKLVAQLVQEEKSAPMAAK